jgi:hypothetical protein
MPPPIALAAPAASRTNFVDELLLSSRRLFARKLLEETLPHHDGRVCSQEGTNVPIHWFRVTVLPSLLRQSRRRWRGGGCCGAMGNSSGGRKERESWTDDRTNKQAQGVSQ